MFFADLFRISLFQWIVRPKSVFCHGNLLAIKVTCDIGSSDRAATTYFGPKMGIEIIMNHKTIILSE